MIDTALSHLMAFQSVEQVPIHCIVHQHSIPHPGHKLGAVCADMKHDKHIER